MHALRQARFLARLVLAWFALSLGVAVASPLINPQQVELVCSGSGAMKLLVKGADGTPGAAGHNLECPLCASLDAPPVLSGVRLPPLQALDRATPAHPPARVAAPSSAPPPARGPPLRLVS